jgi:hypothetical protein
VNRAQDVADRPVGRSLSFSSRDFVRGSEVDALQNADEYHVISHV